MDCEICLKEYDCKLNIPRILPICGHTLCEVKILFKNFNLLIKRFV